MIHTILALYFLFPLIASLKVGPDDCKEKYCYDLDIQKLHRQHLGTKTAYPQYTDFDSNKEYIVPGCKPQKIWMLIRHGARYPTKKEMHGIYKLFNLQIGFTKYYDAVPADEKCPMCSLDAELIKQWRLPEDFEDLNANILAPGGYTEMRKLARNLVKMYPTLFDQKYSKKNYYFLYSREKRTTYSYNAFMEGLFGENAHEHIQRNRSRDEEHLLKPYAYCNASIQNSGYVDRKDGEPYKFIQSPPFQRLLRDISLRLGLEKIINDTSVIDGIWSACKYEQSWDLLKPSPWCAVLLPSHYELLDYYDDLSYYYKKSYGSPINLKLACSAINDMIYHLDNNGTEKVVAYIVHSTLMTLFLNTLEAFKDPIPLRHDNYEQMHNRTFRNSVILPLQSNFAMVKYQCPNAAGSKEKIMFMLNQQPYIFNWCNGRFCEIDMIKKVYAPYAAMNCSAEYCDPSFMGFNENSDSSACGTLWLPWIFSVIILILSQLLNYV